MAIQSLGTCRIAPAVPLREVRLAVSMVGGTSLAIYENGVTQELLRLVQGRGAYGLIKRLTRSHAYVDILSGTSAGGINTIFLSTALTNGKDTWSTRDVWIDVAGIDELLPDPYNRSVRSILKGNSYYRPVLLDAFKGVYAGAGGTAAATSFPLRSGYHPRPGGEDYGPLDLFVTGTYIEGMPSVFFDTRNQPIFNENHNGVFHLKHRPVRGESHFCPELKDPAGRETGPPVERKVYSPGGGWPARDPYSTDRAERREAICQRLAIIARTTSSLPAIFEPSAVPHHLMKGIIPLPAGRKPDPETGGEFSYFGDGGYLNNRPINLVLEKIRRRASGPEVLRKLVFVEPVAEKLARQKAEQEEPTALQHLRFYGAVQGKQSLRDQLASVLEHNHRVRRVRAALACARKQVEQSEQPGRANQGEAVDPSYKLWVELRLQELRDTVIERWEQSFSRSHQPDFIQGGEQVLKDAKRTQDQAERLRELRAELLKHLEESCECGDGNAGSPLAGIDADYLGRKILRLKDDIRDTFYPRIEELDARREQQRRQEVLTALSGRPGADLKIVAGLERLSQLHEVAEFVQVLLLDVVDAVARTGAFTSYLDASPDSLSPAEAAEKLWDKLSTAALALLAPIEPLNPDQVDRFLDALRKRSTAICKAVINEAAPGQEPAPEGALFVLKAIDREVGRTAEQLAECLEPVIRLEFTDPPVPHPFQWAYRNGTPRSWPEMDEFLRRLDHQLYPVERAADLPCLSPIELVHISARDVQVGLSRETPDNKLAGDVLMNLGGFFKRSWRVNDVLWGRLDASGALVEMLLDPARLERVVREARKQDQGRQLLHALRGYLLTGDATLDLDAPLPKADSIGLYLHSYPKEAQERDLDAVLKTAEEWLGKNDEELVPQWVVEQLTRWLLRRHQLEILTDEMPAAIAADLAEHCEWLGAGLETQRPTLQDFQAVREDKRFAKRARGALSALVDLSSGSPGRTTRKTLRALSLDLVLRLLNHRPGAAAPGGGGEAAAAASLNAAEVHRYFRSRYETGAEAVATDIPPLITARRIATALLVTLNVLQTSLRSGKSRATAEAVTRLLKPVTLFLHAVHGFITLLSTGRGPAIALHAILLTLMAGWAALRLGNVRISGAEGTVLNSVAGCALILELGYWSWLRGPKRTLGGALMAAGAVGGGVALFRWLQQRLPVSVPSGISIWQQLTSPWVAIALLVVGVVLYCIGRKTECS